METDPGCTKSECYIYSNHIPLPETLRMIKRNYLDSDPPLLASVRKGIQSALQ